MRNAFTRWATRDWRLKLIALGLALGVWLLLAPSQKMSSEKSLTIPLETRNVPPGLEVVERPVPTVDITLRAPNRLLKEIGPSGLVARLDLDRATVLQQEYALSTAMIAVPPGAQVVKISPSKVTVKLEHTASASLEVHATLSGRPAAGFHVDGVEIDPPTVAVQGPESRLKAKKYAATAPVDITGVSQPTVFDADIILPWPELRFVSSRTDARVSVHVAPDQAPAKPAPKRKKP
jgi:YbbR domain-containing protein